ncbi:acyltransferase family protein [Caballeronia sp. DA-9]|uniref:acyltransferase family protein n=1 Tax=Caballeronia sp. DA-9 TaxID=3436237 RepID=UPI003F662C1B
MSDSSLLNPGASRLRLSPERAATLSLDEKDIAINAWRGFAALLVAYFHCRQITWIGIQQFHKTAAGFDLNTLFSYLTFPIAWGSAGVPIFFVISGYCIHRGTARKLIANPSAPFDTRNFLMRRFARIYPVLLAALVLTYLLDSWSRSFTPTSPKIGTLDLHLFIVNLLSLQGVAGKTFGSNGALWTLSLEVQFYLVYPLLIALRRRIGMKAVLVSVGIVNVASALVFERHEIVLFASYWFSWTLGAWIAEAKAAPNASRSASGSWKLQVAAVVVALLGCAAFQIGQYLAFQLWAVAFALYLYQVLDKPMRNSLPVKGFSWLGEFSFSLYVVHIPILVFLGSLLFRSALQTEIWPSFVFMLAPVAVAFGFYRLVERPAMHWSASLKRKQANVT